MQIKLNYTFEGYVPPRNELHFCLYLSPEGQLSFGIARSERNIETNKWEWNKEFGDAFNGAPPFAYMTVEGSVDTVIQQLKREGYTVLEPKLESQP